MIFATLKALTTMTPFIREKRLIFASKNPLTTSQEAKDATAHELRNEITPSRRNEEEGGEKGRIIVKREKKVSP